MKKIIISLSLLFICCGCFNKIELNDYAIVTGISIDKEKDEYTVSFLISNSQKSGDQNKNSETQSVIYEGKDNSLYGAIKKIGLISSKELYIEHVTILLISEEVAKEGLTNITDFFLREPSAKNQFLVAIAKDTKAKNLLEILSPLDDFESQNISNNITSASKLQGEIVQTNFNELLDSMIKKGSNPVLNSIVLVGNAKKGSTKEALETSKIKNYVKLDNLGIFKNNKLIHWANTKESIGINLINNKIEQTYVKIKQNNGLIIVGTKDYKSKIKIKLENNKPKVIINAHSTATIDEVDTNSIDLSKEKVIKEIENKAEKELKKYINSAITLAKKYKTDIFEIGNFYYKNYPKYYIKSEKNWNDKIFPNIEFKINISVDLESKGSAENIIERIKHE